MWELICTRWSLLTCYRKFILLFSEFTDCWVNRLLMDFLNPVQFTKDTTRNCWSQQSKHCSVYIIGKHVSTVQHSPRQLSSHSATVFSSSPLWRCTKQDSWGRVQSVSVSLPMGDSQAVRTFKLTFFKVIKMENTKQRVLFCATWPLVSAERAVVSADGNCKIILWPVHWTCDFWILRFKL